MSTAPPPLLSRPSRRPTGLQGKPSAVCQPLEWERFVTHCVRSWVAAGASVRAFLDHWTSVGFRNVGPSVGPRRRSAQRRPRPPHPVPARRAANRPLPADAAGVGDIGVDGIEPAALRRSFPHVAELLVEMAAQPAGERRRAGARKS